MTKDEKVVPGGDIEFAAGSSQADGLVAELPLQEAVPASVTDDLSEIVSAYICQIGEAFNIPPHARPLFAYGYHVVPSARLYDFFVHQRSTIRTYTVRPFTNIDNIEDAEEILKYACPELKDKNGMISERHVYNYNVDFKIFPEYAVIEGCLHDGKKYNRYLDYPDRLAFDFLRVPPTARTFFLGVLHNKGPVNEFNSVIQRRAFKKYYPQLDHCMSLNDVLAYAKKIHLKDDDAIKYAKMLPR